MSPDEQEHARLAEALTDPLLLALMVRFSPDLRMAEKAVRLALALARAHGRADDKSREERGEG